MDYSIHLQSVDDPDNPSLCSCSATSVVSDTTIELTLQWCLTCGLQRHRVYSFVINSINNAGTSTSDPVELSNTCVLYYYAMYIGFENQKVYCS